MFQYGSEDIELPADDNNYYQDEKPQNEEEDLENENRKKKNIIIAIIVILGVIVLGVIIFLVIFFSSKKTKDGGSITLVYELESEKEMNIFNVGNLKSDDYTIEEKENDPATIRRLEENIYSIANGVLTFNDKKERTREFTFNIKFMAMLTKLDGMFKDIKYLKKADFSEFKSEKIKNMNSLFSNCEKLKYVDFTNFNSKNVESMDNTFDSCRELEELDLSSFVTPKLKSMKSTFKDCENLKYLDLTNFELNKNIVDRESIFEGDDNLITIKINNNNTNELLIAEIKNNNTISYSPICEEGKEEEECHNCNKEKTQCLSCDNGYFLTSYLSIVNKCYKCRTGCKDCIEFMNCQECINNKYELIDKVCNIIPGDTSTNIDSRSIDNSTKEDIGNIYDYSE